MESTRLLSRASKSLTLFDVHVRPQILSKANHASLLPIETDPNKTRNLHGSIVGYAEIDQTAWCNSPYSRGKYDVCFDVSCDANMSESRILLQLAPLYLLRQRPRLLDQRHGGSGSEEG